MTDRPDLLARTWSVTNNPSTVPMMRQRVQRRLASWGIALEADLEYGVRLVVSELVTNAILHSSTSVLSVSLVVSPALDELFVAVEDGDADHPARSASDEELPEHGRGLQIVSDVVSRWGVDSTEVGKRVWAVIPRAAPPSSRVQADGDQLIRPELVHERALGVALR